MNQFWIIVIAAILLTKVSEGYLTRVFRRSTPVTTVLKETSTPSARDSEVKAKEDDGKYAGDVFSVQKNDILLEKFTETQKRMGNLTATADEFVNFCDESFNQFLNQQIAQRSTEAEKQILGQIRYEVNSARQRKLIDADKILRGILAAGGLKQMEAKLKFHLAKSHIDMAFMVILQLNIEDAKRANAEKATQVMTHLSTMIVEHQDSIVSPPVRLLRLLMRTDDSFVRKQMLRQKLILVEGADDENDGSDVRKDVTKITPLRKTTSESGELSFETVSEEEDRVTSPEGDEEAEAMATTTPQCEHIVVDAVQKWGGADVTVQQLQDTINDVLAQMSDIGGEEATLEDLESKCDILRQEIQEVLAELDTPRVSDQCEDD